LPKRKEKNFEILMKKGRFWPFLKFQIKKNADGTPKSIKKPQCVSTAV